MLGELLFEIKGRLTGYRILNAEEYKIEHSLTQEGKQRYGDCNSGSILNNSYRKKCNLW
ncbi:MAG TPA: hypothetical protein VE307_10475 [Nitrososphaeraceae archaeon]|nr:hypothetical protein [Nitrososphaeraceae archaeon]